jgi:two-component system, OmpR family, sensor histidine kinase ChvG
MHETPSFFRSLRFKLLLASLTLLLIPWAGYHYLQGMENALREAQQRLLMNRAEILSNMLSSGSLDWLHQIPDETLNSAQSLYVFPLDVPPVIDGYAEEWLDLKAQSERFSARSAQNRAVSFDWLAGFYDEDLYLLIEVYDGQLVYPRNEQRLESGDHLILAFPGAKGHTRQFLLGTQAPGWINVREADTNRRQARIFGEWQETGSGYRVELRLPRALTNGRLSLVAIDIDQTGQKPVGIASTSGWQQNQSLAYLTLPSPQAEQLLHGLGSQGHRYTLLNRQRQVVGRYGTIAASVYNQDNLLQRLASLLLSDSPPELFSKREKLGKLDGPEIRQALSGEGAVYRYQSPGTNLMMLSSAFPILVKGKIRGAVVVEQSTQEILILQQTAIEELLMISLGLFILTGGSLLLLASSITSRITRLSRKYQQAVSQDGRVLRDLTASSQKDELGQLDTSLSSVLKRTKAYSHYLESMASRLAHEFRTPLTVIQSSLENLQAEIESNPETINKDSPALTYAARAQEGTGRLNQILTRLREATRLEQSLQDAEMADTDMTALMNALIQGYADSYKAIEFNSKLPDHPTLSHLSADLISQAMDKLVSNAVDFHRPETPIQIQLISNSMDRVTIKVINQGPQLNQATSQTLFSSMSSRRPSTDQQQPHLGLGLYLVRLIAEFHQGRAWAENLEDGVCFAIDLPLN